MFNHVSTAGVIVTDQDKAKDFYVNVLGFTVRTDDPIYPGAPNRWLTVAPNPNATTTILLDLPTPEGEHMRALIGKSQTVTLNVSGIRELVPALQAKGVQFEGGIMEAPWGAYAFMYDQDHNMLLLVEPPGQ